MQVSTCDGLCCLERPFCLSHTGLRSSCRCCLRSTRLTCLSRSLYDGRGPCITLGASRMRRARVQRILRVVPHSAHNGAAGGQGQPELLVRFFAPWAGIDEDPVTGEGNISTSAFITLNTSDNLPSVAHALCMCTSCNSHPDPGSALVTARACPHDATRKAVRGIPPCCMQSHMDACAHTYSTLLSGRCI